MDAFVSFGPGRESAVKLLQQLLHALEQGNESNAQKQPISL